MEQDITELKKSFEDEYRLFLADDRGNREFRQGDLFDFSTKKAAKKIWRLFFRTV